MACLGFSTVFRIIVLLERKPPFQSQICGIFLEFESSLICTYVFDLWGEFLGLHAVFRFVLAGGGGGLGGWLLLQGNVLIKLLNMSYHFYCHTNFIFSQQKIELKFFLPILFRITIVWLQIQCQYQTRTR